MAESMNPREVLRYLNGLGYKNITAEHLKEFMTGINETHSMVLFRTLYWNLFFFFFRCNNWHLIDVFNINEYDY